MNNQYSQAVVIPTTERESLNIPDLSDDATMSYDPATVILACLLVMAVLTACFYAAEVVLPILLAFLLKLLLQPPMRLFARWRVPRSIAALLIILAVFAIMVAGVAAIVGPATTWAQKLPEGLPRLEEKLQVLSGPFSALQTFLRQLDGRAADASTGLGISGFLFKGTQHLATEILETILVLFFLLVSGDTFLRRFVEILPKFRDKRQVVALSQQIEENIAAYLSTISAMNALVGVATALAMWLCGLGDPLLWGGIAFLLNYIPIMGPITGLGLFLFAGLLTIDDGFGALVPAALYLGIHLVEGEIVTPMLLAHRFTLNPVLVIIAVIFWFWMWGVPGAILAVPLLAIVKIICDGVRPLNAIGHFLEG